MKKITLLTALLISSQLLFSQNVIEKLCAETATEIAKQLKSHKKASEIKVAVLNFAEKNEYSDSTKSAIGANISKALEQALQLAFTNKGLKAKVLSNNKSADELMELGTTIPEGVNENDFLKEYLGNITPNYTLTGIYEIKNL